MAEIVCYFLSSSSSRLLLCPALLCPVRSSSLVSSHLFFLSLFSFTSSMSICHPNCAPNIFLSAQYYSSAIAEIGLAILATSIILNFHYRKNQMPRYLRKLVFSFVGPIVGIKKHKNLSKSEKLLRRSHKRSNGKSKDNEHFMKGNNCELKSLSLLQNDSISSVNEPKNEFQRGKNHNNIRETHILAESDDNTADQKDRRNDAEKELAEIYAKEWQEAARILDRLVLLVAIILCVCTFGAIFVQAPRVQENLFGEPAITEEQRLINIGVIAKIE